MPVLSANSPRQQQLLKDFAAKLAIECQKLAPAVTGEVDYGMLAVPIVGLAVDLLKQRGLSKDEIENFIYEIADRQFSQVQSPILKIVR